jgi:hypothetical protein
MDTHTNRINLQNNILVTDNANGISIFSLQVSLRYTPLHYEQTIVTIYNCTYIFFNSSILFSSFYQITSRTKTISIEYTITSHYPSEMDCRKKVKKVWLLWNKKSTNFDTITWMANWNKLYSTVSKYVSRQKLNMNLSRNC